MARLVKSRAWRRTHVVAQWFLIVVFSFLTIAHLILTALFFAGAWDTGVGFVLNWEWPSWLITIMDGTAVWLIWKARSACDSHPWGTLINIGFATVIVVSRAAWMVLVPLAALVLIVDAVVRLRTPPAPGLA